VWLHLLVPVIAVLSTVDLEYASTAVPGNIVQVHGSYSHGCTKFTTCVYTPDIGM
jgi:hypothetical protein